MYIMIAHAEASITDLYDVLSFMYNVFCFSIHILFAMFDAVRNSFGNLYPPSLLLLFPYFHYPIYR